MMPAIDSFLATWSPRVLSILRIIVGLLFLEHGTSKYLSLPVSPSTGVAPMSLSGISGMIELVGGVLIRARLIHTSGRVHPGRRHGRRILHSARAEGLLSAPERG
jgi:hypothetical protein